jgi:protein SCO1
MHEGDQSINQSRFECLPRAFAIVRAMIMVLLAAPFDGSAGAASGTNVTTYAVKGVFMESRSAGRVAVIAHEEIPGYMAAMTMPFNVKDSAEIMGLQAGDQITFRLSVTDKEDWIDDIMVIGKGAKSAVAVPPPPDTLGKLGPGAVLPDFTLTNQAGQVIHTAAFKGQALAFTFFFSRCPLPTFCPRMNNNLLAVQQALQADATRTNWHLISITFDPSFDTPQFLSGFSKLQQADPRHWSFATASPDEIQRLGGAFGLKFWRENGSISHNLRTVVVNASGRVQKVFGGNDWKPAQLVKEVRKAMRASS